MEHLPDRNTSPLHAGYRRDQGRTWDVNRKYLNLTDNIITCSRKLWSAFTNTPWCVQVIMIECADLKNVINYQEVEALKHTIKVHGGRATRVWLDSRRVNPCNNFKKSLPCRFYPSSSGGVLRAMNCHLSFGNRWSTTCLLNAERLCPDARYAAFNIDQKDCYYLCQGGYVFR